MSLWSQINESASGVVEHVAQSVVQIVTDEGSVGAGTLWDANGTVLTNAHVALGRRGARKLEVILADNRRFAAQLLAYDEANDLAALHIDAQSTPALVRGDSSQIHAGDFMMALGHPWGMVDALTAGVVIGKGSQLPEMEGRDWIALDMKMRPGHSGGALFNTDGALMGINTLIRGPEVSFAVPVNTAKIFMREALKQAAPPQNNTYI